MALSKRTVPATHDSIAGHDLVQGHVASSSTVGTLNP